MIDGSKAFSGFAVTDAAVAKEFYGSTLGLEIEEIPNMGMILKVGGGNGVFVYTKENHQPATFTILNFPVDDIDAAVDELSAKGVSFERYEGMQQDDKGIARGLRVGRGPDIAWFKDPSSNILAVLQNS